MYALPIPASQTSSAFYYAHFHCDSCNADDAVSLPEAIEEEETLRGVG